MFNIFTISFIESKIVSNKHFTRSAWWFNRTSKIKVQHPTDFAIIMSAPIRSKNLSMRTFYSLSATWPTVCIKRYKIFDAMTCRQLGLLCETLHLNFASRDKLMANTTLMTVSRGSTLYATYMKHLLCKWQSTGMLVEIEVIDFRDLWD